MARFEPLIWDDLVCVGVDAIDAEHQGLFDRYNALIEVAGQPAPRSEVEAALTALEDYARTHFSHEEALMVEVDYPHYAGHRALHDLFIVDLHRMSQSFQAGEDILEDLCRFLRDWLLSHIVVRDTAVADHIPVEA